MKHNTIYIDKGTKCKKCGNDTIILRHKTIDNVIKKRQYYYSQWEKCEKCWSIWFDPKYIIKTEKLEKEKSLFDI